MSRKVEHSREQRPARKENSGPEAAVLSVRIQPRASKNEITVMEDGKLKIRLTAPPVDGAANRALCRLIARRARVGIRSVTIVPGEGSREKLVRVRGIDAKALRAALGLDDQS
jgi:uncharacterized protein (TIGR00251 family)